MAYKPRTYRAYSGSGDLVSFRVEVKETDLFISAESDLSDKAISCVKILRAQLEKHIEKYPDFKDSLRPVSVPDDAPLVVKDMAEAAKRVDVGPMAAVAGAFAEHVGKELLKHSAQVIIENGGDVFISSKKPRTIGIYAGKSKFSEKIGIRIKAKETPCGICTSSGTVGHSLSFGRADAVAVLAKSASLADAAATAFCNRVKNKDDIDGVLGLAKKTKGIDGVLIIIGGSLGAWGSVKIVEI